MAQKTAPIHPFSFNKARCAAAARRLIVKSAPKATATATATATAKAKATATAKAKAKATAKATAQGSALDQPGG